MPSESAPYRPYGKKDRDAVIKSAVDAIKQGRFEDITDEETFRQARIQYIRERRTPEGGWEKKDDTLERLYGDLEKSWKTAQEVKKKRKQETPELTREKGATEAYFMSEEDFRKAHGDLSSIQEETSAIPITENVPVIPYGFEEEMPRTETGSTIRPVSDLKKGDLVLVEIKLSDGTKKKVRGEVFRANVELKGEGLKTLISYRYGLSKDEELALAGGGIIVADQNVIELLPGQKEAEFVEMATEISPRDRIYIMENGDKAFRVVGIGPNSSQDNPTIIVLSEEVLKNGPKPEDEIEIPRGHITQIKKYNVEKNLTV